MRNSELGEDHSKSAPVVPAGVQPVMGRRSLAVMLGGLSLVVTQLAPTFGGRALALGLPLSSRGSSRSDLTNGTDSAAAFVDAFWTAQAISTENDRRYSELVSRQVGAVVQHDFDGTSRPEGRGTRNDIQARRGGPCRGG
jgi:hypothetical protein